MTSGPMANYAVTIAYKSGSDVVDRAAGMAAAFMAGATMQTFYAACTPAVTTIDGSKMGQKLKPEVLASIVNKFGFFDFGTGYEKYPVFRPTAMSFLAKYLKGEIDVEQFIRDYKQTAEAALK